MNTRDGPVIVVSVNTAVDRVLLVPELNPGEVHRVREQEEAGGKSINVARSLVRHGVPVEVLGFAGGATGAFVRQRVREHGIEARWVETQGAARTCDIVVETNHPRSTVFNGEGPEVSPAESEALEAMVLERLPHCPFLVLTGSLCPGVPDGLYARWIDAAHAHGVPVAVDAYGPSLRLAASAGPEIVKVNEEELRETFGDAPPAVASQLLRRGARWVIVTRGGEGAVGFSAEGNWHVPAPEIEVRNATGSGDAFLGGVVSAWLRGADLRTALKVATAAGSASATNLMAAIPPEADLERLAERLVPTRLDH